MERNRSVRLTLWYVSVFRFSCSKLVLNALAFQFSAIEINRKLAGMASRCSSSSYHHYNAYEGRVFDSKSSYGVHLAAPRIITRVINFSVTKSQLLDWLKCRNFSSILTCYMLYESNWWQTLSAFISTLYGGRSGVTKNAI